VPSTADGRHFHIGIEHLRRSDGALAQRLDPADLDAGQLRVHEEIGDSFLLARSIGRPCHQQAVVAQVHARREDLLAVDHVAAVRGHRSGRQRRSIGARLRLREAEAERQLAARNPRQEPLLLFARSVLHHRVAAIGQRAKYPHPQLFEMPSRLLEQDGQLGRRRAGTAVLGGQYQPEPAVLRERLVGFPGRAGLFVAALRILGRAHLTEQRLQVAAQRFLFRA
jgi:hypothetical protein